MKVIILNNKMFNYEHISSLKKELNSINIIISETASIGNNTKIGENTKIGDNTRIGNNTRIRKNSRIGDNVTIGDDVTIGDNAVICDDVTIGDNANIDNDSSISRSVVITALRFTVSWYNNGYIAIGCKTLSIEQWQDHYIQIGVEYNLTTKEIAEYKVYIDFCASMQELV